MNGGKAGQSAAADGGPFIGFLRNPVQQSAAAELWRSPRSSPCYVGFLQSSRCSGVSKDVL